MYCPKCNQVIKDKSEFCIYCGEIFNPELLRKKKINKCPKCGARLPEDSEFCIRCGEIFDLKMVDDKILKKEEIIELYMGNTNLMMIKSFLFSYLFFFYKKTYFAGFFSYFFITLLIINMSILEASVSVDNDYYRVFIGLTKLTSIIYFLVIVVMAKESKRILFNYGLKYALFTLSVNNEENYNDLKEKIKIDLNKKKKKGIIIGLVALIFHILLIILLN